MGINQLDDLAATEVLPCNHGLQKRQQGIDTRHMADSFNVQHLGTFRIEPSESLVIAFAQQCFVAMTS